MTDTDKKDAYYFNHYSNARNDRKVRKLRLQLGIEGYGIYFGILENLREQKSFKYPITDLDVLAADLDTSMQKVEVVVRGYGLFQIDESEEFFSPAQLRALQKWVDIKEMNRLKGIKSGLSKRKKMQDQIKELKALEELSQSNSIKPQLNSGSTVVELGENTTVQDNTEQLTYDNTSNTNENDLLEEWLDEYSNHEKVINPIGYKKHMRKQIKENDQEALQAFEEWKKRKIKSRTKYEAERKITDFDYSLIEGMSISGNKIVKVRTEKGISTLHVRFDDGSENSTMNKKYIYDWYKTTQEEIA